jgi:hypothetical protein
MIIIKPTKENSHQFTETISGSSYIEVEIGNSKNLFDNIRFLYDSGATMTILSNNDLELLGYEYMRLNNDIDWKSGKYMSGFDIHNTKPRFHYKAPDKTDVRFAGKLADGNSAVTVPIELTSIKIAGVEFKNFPVLTYYKTKEQLQTERAKPPKEQKKESNLLGTDLLKYFQRYIDYDNGRLIFDKRASFNELLDRTKKAKYYSERELLKDAMIHSFQI